MKQILFSLAVFFFLFSASAQNNFSCIVKDETTKEPLQGVTANIAGTNKSVASDNSGRVTFKNLVADKIKIIFSFVGYESQTIVFSIPPKDSLQIVSLPKAGQKTEEEVIVSSSKTNSRIEDLPTKVEVIGSEEVDEEASTMPGNLSSLFGDVAGIQNQKTSSTTSNVELRVQGLPGKYTQILRDGMPLFGGYSGSFSLLQIPPLDLKQVEIVKGSNSTLYGGGAIAGMINLISKTPKLYQPQHSLLFNRSTLNETNINTFHSNRNKKTGYTFFAGTTLQRAVDVNKDGFSDVPDITSFFFHPKLFLYPDNKNTVSLEYNVTYENRNGGDMQVLHKTKDNLHQFFIQNKSFRNSFAGNWENKLNKNDRINFKGSASFFNRDITTNVFGMKAKQLAYFSELAYLKKLKAHTIVAGLNCSGENFNKKLPDSTRFDDYHYQTAGLFIQDDWKVSQKLTAQAGVRRDNHNKYDNFILPRLSLLYKISNSFTTRLGGGFGYKIPSQFENDVDEREYKNYFPAVNLSAEKSKGINWDINFKTSADEWGIMINQMFYVTEISKPVVEQNFLNGDYSYYNATKPINTKGFETYIQLSHDELEVYLGYTYTIAKQLYNTTQPFVPLNARSKFAAVISNEFSNRFRACIELSYTGRQYLDNGTKTAGYFISAPMIRYDIKNVSVVLNCENIFDYRQTRKESIVYGSVTNPSFKQLWAPTDGRVANLSVRINW